MQRFTLLFTWSILGSVLFISCNFTRHSNEEFTGSQSCIECHADFHKLWSTSHHGLAMQGITRKFIRNEITTEQEEVFMEEAYFSPKLKDTVLYIQKRTDKDTSLYEVLWALGGKNVYYFLTPHQGGRLQTLPLAYNVHTDLWYNNPESAVRHFPTSMSGEETDEALPWEHSQYTFNTSCYSCHVSQLSNNYNIETNTYQTHWKEVGINCETCHGPAEEHIKAARFAERKGVKLEEIKLVVTSDFTPEQHNASCNSCHAKMRAITPSFMPGENFFDNYDLITLEHSDFYADGRDLGENYTATSWHMNSCAKNSELHCVTCHTSSGRYRFESDDLSEANKACTSCHTEKEKFYEQHTHHELAENSPRCIDCHMPMTTFGHMNRSDHSFRPPMPKASMEFGSPHACNICHEDKDATWSQKQLDMWGKDKHYQDETLEAGRLLLQARVENWKNINDILEAVSTNLYGEVYTTSLLRLLTNYPDTLKRASLIEALDFESPLIRSAAATAFFGLRDELSKNALLRAASDSVRVVRLASAASLSLFPLDQFSPTQRTVLDSVEREYITSLVTRPDNWSSHYNLGNHFQNQGKNKDAITSYLTSLKINPEAILPHVNISYLHALNGDQENAKKHLENALSIEPDNEAANFNYALLMAELKKMSEAETALRTVMKVNPNNAVAAYNLAVIVAAENPEEACAYSEIAYKHGEQNPKYAYTFAYYLYQNDQKVKAKNLLSELVKIYPDYFSMHFLLATIYEDLDNIQGARLVYENLIKENIDNEQLVLDSQHRLRNLN